MDERTILDVMDDHAGELMRTPGVVGVAVGALQDGTPCIVIFGREITAELARALPESLEGHPVDLRLGGDIRPL